MPRKAKQRPNPGWFRKGHDPRRHQLTQEERQRGYRNAVAEPKAGTVTGENVHVLAWVFRRVRSYYRRKRSEG
jgi:hypothetical protein